MKDLIDDMVGVLVGLPLSYIERSADMLTLGFGQVRERVRRGRVRKESDFAVHIQCP